MKLMKQFRSGRGYRRLDRQVRQRAAPHRSVPFGEAGTFGLLFRAGTLEDVLEVKEFAGYLKKEGKKVSVLGYVSPAEETRFKTKSVFFEYFTEKDLDLFFLPKLRKTKNFLEEPFDVLVNLATSDCLPLAYLTGLSKATFRVGAYSPRNVPYFDLMIDLKEDRNIGNFAIQLKQYLSLPASA